MVGAGPGNGNEVEGPAAVEALKEVLENSLTASYMRDLSTGTYTYMSPVVASITGYSVDEVLSFSSEHIASMTHPDDKGAMLDLVVDVSDKSKADKSFQVEYRMGHKEGHYIWILHRFKFKKNVSGDIIARIGTICDVTERKNMEMEPERERYLFKALMDSTSDHIFFKIAKDSSSGSIRPPRCS